MEAKETTLKEIGEMLAYVVEHMVTKDPPELDYVFLIVCCIRSQPHYVFRHLIHDCPDESQTGENIYAVLAFSQDRCGDGGAEAGSWGSARIAGWTVLRLRSCMHRRSFFF